MPRARLRPRLAARRKKAHKAQRGQGAIGIGRGKVKKNERDVARNGRPGIGTDTDAAGPGGWYSSSTTIAARSEIEFSCVAATLVRGSS